MTTRFAGTSLTALATRVTGNNMKAILSPKGELLIPGDLMERYGLSGGTAVDIEPREGEIVLRPAASPPAKARLVRHGDDSLLEAPSDAPPMTAQNVKRLLEDWP